MLKVLLILFLFSVQGFADTNVSECNDDVFLSELVTRTTCAEEVGIKSNCRYVQLAQRTDAPAETMQFLLSVDMPDAAVKKALASETRYTSVKKIFSKYRHDMANVEFGRSMVKSIQPDKANDPKWDKYNQEFYDREALPAKKALYEKFGFEFNKSPKVKPTLEDGKMPYFDRSTPVERYFAIRNQIVDEFIKKERPIDAATKAKLKVAYKKMTAYKFKISAGKLGGKMGGAGANALMLLPDIIDPGNIKTLDSRKLTCGDKAFEAYNELPKDFKKNMDMENCNLSVTPEGLSSILGGEGIELVQKHPKLCDVMKAQLERLRAKQGFYVQKVGTITPAAAQPGNR